MDNHIHQTTFRIVSVNVVRLLLEPSISNIAGTGCLRAGVRESYLVGRHLLHIHIKMVFTDRTIVSRENHIS